MKSFRRPGWQFESTRHSLAARGITTGFFARNKRYPLVRRAKTEMREDVFIAIPGNYRGKNPDLAPDESSVKNTVVDRFGLRDANERLVVPEGLVEYEGRLYRVKNLTFRQGEGPVLVLEDEERGIRIGADPRFVEVKDEFFASKSDPVDEELGWMENVVNSNSHSKEEFGVENRWFDPKSDVVLFKQGENAVVRVAGVREVRDVKGNVLQRNI